MEQELSKCLPSKGFALRIQLIHVKQLEYARAHNKWWKKMLDTMQLKYSQKRQISKL